MCTRALENKVIAVTANRCGSEEHNGETLVFSGESQITDMNGRPLAVAGPEEECVITAEVRPFATRSKSFNPFNDILADRRPEMYD
jgi:predicted amidohydrolase